MALTVHLDPAHPERRHGVRELCSGIDALYLSGRAELPDGLLLHLEQLRLAAEAADEPQPFDLAGVEFFVQPRAFGKYRYRLSHERGLIGITPSEHLPALRVQPRAEFIHGVGPAGVVEFFNEVGEYLVGGPVYWSLSRLDLFCDVQGWALHGDLRERFVSRSSRRDLHEDGGELLGFEFGRRTSKSVCARIYDKTRQAADKGLDYWPAIWGDRYDTSQHVLRIEAEIGRLALTEFGVDTPGEGIAQAGAMWGHITEKWLTYRTPTADETRSRWPIAAEWAAIQQAELRQCAAGLDRVRALKRKGRLRTITPQLVGYLATAGSLMGTADLASTLAGVRHLVANDEVRRGISFDARIAERSDEAARS